MNAKIHLGYAVGTGDAVGIPLRHMVITGQTQEAGKTTALEALIARAGVKAIVFLTKRGEGSFAAARVIPPYFREKADWQFVASILEASRGEKLKFERAWIIRASKGARTLADVQGNVQRAMQTAKGLSADVYLTLDAYLDAVVPQIAQVRWAPRVDLRPGVNAMDLTGLTVEMQHLVIRSTIEWVQEQEQDTVVVVPEAWKFLPQGRGTPVKLAAESFIRQAAALRNYLWLDSQDIAGVEKIILKSVAVWILGVQRESNEVKRTLDQIPAGTKKPKLDDVQTLALGHFFACHGTHITEVYVQPTWVNDLDAIAIARGVLAIEEHPPAPRRGQLQEPTVNEAEARQLRDDNVELRRRVRELEEALHRTSADSSSAKGPESAPVSGHRDHGNPGSTPGSADALYHEFKTRLLREPSVLRVLAEQPEIRVEIERVVIDARADTLRGRIARLIADDFFADGQSAPAAQKELGRRGLDPGPANVYKELDALALLGFLTIEQGKDDRSRPRKEYRAVPGMKVNVVKR
ncbi:MAG: hypothetical protein HOP28_12990 [Gemmatimonadales bacterium]|nr:hypothetical protein [Gemmatimonadales bacterium]